MDITASNYFMDITEKGFRFFFSYKIGIQRLDNGKKTLPSFDRVITSDKYIFVETNKHWGILDMDLCLIVPPIYKELIPVMQIDRDNYFSICMSNQSAACITFNTNSNYPTHVAIQTKRVVSNNRYGIGVGGGIPSYPEFTDEEKVRIFEIRGSLENVQTDLFVAISDVDDQLINLEKTEINQNYTGYEFLPLWHYKDNMFIVRNNNGSIATSTYKHGRFLKKDRWGENNDSCKNHGCSRIIMYKNEFVSVCYSPIIEDNDILDVERKWALFKYNHKEAENSNDWWDWYNNTEETAEFEQLTSFVFEKPMTQLQDDNVFICHGDGVDILMRFEQKGAEKCETLTIDEKYKTKPCSQGQLNIIACYNTIELREDGLYDVSTEDGYGLCDKDMQVIVPAKYDYPIECGEYLMIGVKNSSLLNNLKRYGYFVANSSNPILTSEDLTDDIHYLNGNSSEGFCDLEEIVITKDVSKLEWNGLGRCRFRRFKVVPENKIFCEVDGVLYTRKGYDREGDTHRKQMIELVACPTNVPTHNVMPGTKRIANCAFKGSMIETLQLPDTLEEIGVNAFYLTPNLKYLKLPMSIRKIYAQDVGKSGDISPHIEYDSHSFSNWDNLYEYMLGNGFDKKNGNIERSN